MYFIYRIFECIDDDEHSVHQYFIETSIVSVRMMGLTFSDRVEQSVSKGSLLIDACFEIMTEINCR
jgi:hypothetical protein